MYRNISAFEHPELSHKDTVISTLKKQLSELQDIEVDFYKVNDQISKLESKYSLLLQDKDRNDKEHKLRMEIGKKAIAELRADVDKLKIHIHKTGFQAQQIARQNSTLKRIVDNRNAEIDGLVMRNSELEKKNQIQAEENRNIAFNIKQIKEQKAKLEAECQKIHALLDTNILNLKNIQKQARVLESTSTKLDKSVAEAERDNQQLLAQLKGKETSISKLDKTLEGLELKTETQRNRNTQLDNDAKRIGEDIQKSTVTLNSQLSKNKELSTKLKSLDNTIRATQQQLEQVVNKKQGLKQQHYDLINDNKQLNGDIDTTLMNILEYEKMNSQLQKQIENYIETDEQARNLLNRKHVMKTLLEQVNMRLEKTGDQIAHLR